MKHTIDTTPIASTKETFDFDDATINITGRASNGTRAACIMIPVTDAEGKRTRTANVRLAGEEFNAFYAEFTSDSKAFEAALKKLGISAKIDDGDMLNAVKVLKK